MAWKRRGLRGPRRVPPHAWTLPTSRLLRSAPFSGRPSQVRGTGPWRHPGSSRLTSPRVNAAFPRMMARARDRCFLQCTSLSCPAFRARASGRFSGAFPGPGFWWVLASASLLLGHLVAMTTRISDLQAQALAVKTRPGPETPTSGSGFRGGGREAAGSGRHRAVVFGRGAEGSGRHRAAVFWGGVLQAQGALRLCCPVA